MIELGDIAKDTVTWFQGVVICKKWLHGCNRLTLQPEGLDKDKKPIESQTFDEPQLVLVKHGKHKSTMITGGPLPEPKQRDTPK